MGWFFLCWGFDHVGGVVVESDLDGGEGIVALEGCGLQVAGDSAVGLGAADGSEASGDLLPISAKGGWKDGSGPYRGVIHHEVGHAFFDKQVGTKTCSSATCTDAIVERWGLDEGIAMIAQEFYTGVDVGDASGDSVQQILSNCSTNDPDGAQACAHDLGRLLVESFNALATEKTPSEAFAYFRDVVTDDLTYGALLDFSDFHEHLGQLIHERDSRPDVEKPPSHHSKSSCLHPIRHRWEFHHRSFRPK